MTTHEITEFIPADVRWARDRAGWTRKYGEQPPPFDPKRRRQSFAFPAAMPGATITYLAMNQVTGEIAERALPGAEAAVPNFPGAYEYPRWEPLKTDPQTEPYLNPRFLCTKEQADMLYQELSALSVAVGKPFQVNRLGGKLIDYKGDPRRQWNITVAGQHLSCGLLLLDRFQDGEGNPNGHWEIVSASISSDPAWIYDPPVTDNDLEWLNWPLRPLKGDERVKMLFGKPVIVSGPEEPGTGGTAPVSVDLSEVLTNQRTIIQQNDLVLALLDEMRG